MNHSCVTSEAQVRVLPPPGQLARQRGLGGEEGQRDHQNRRQASRFASQA